LAIQISQVEMEPKPAWLKIRPPTTDRYGGIKQTIRGLGLHTVCQEAHCPNMGECWSGGTATFMVLGDVCTRGCKFCAVGKGREGRAVDANEPKNLALAVREFGLDYVVITSVDRDDLPDQGAGHFAECVRELKRGVANVKVEVLIPDFRGDERLIKMVADAGPDVMAHNVETVERLQREVRDYRAGYAQSLGVLKFVKTLDKNIYTKSSVMLGLGESEEEVVQTMMDLRANDVDVLTLGQYLRPSLLHASVQEFVAPEKFERLKKKGEEMGFLYVASGPFVRSSYRAGELFIKGLMEKRAREER